MVDGANQHDMKLARATLAGIKANRPQPKATQPQGLSLDKEYDYEEVRPLLVEFGFTAHICARGEEAKKIKQQAGYRARMAG